MSFNLLSNEPTLLKENQNFKVLYIEDDEQIRSRYVGFLKRYFSQVFEAGSVKEALSEYKLQKPDIMIVDLNLPDGTGLSFLKQVRQHDMNTKAIILTAYSDLDFVLEATELKLTKYLIKPVSREVLTNSLQLAVEEITRYELVEKISNLLKICDKYSFDLVNSELYYQDSIVDITPKQKRIIHHLVQNKNNVCTYDDISIAISDYHEEITSKDSLKTLVAGLRKKLYSNFIQNIHSIGYKLTPLYS